MAGIINAITSVFIFSQFSGPRAMPVAGLCAAARDIRGPGAATLVEAIEIGMGLLSESDPLLITGSMFTAGEARRILIDRYAAPPLQL